jgi:hypothetical protein
VSLQRTVHAAAFGRDSRDSGERAAKRGAFQLRLKLRTLSVEREATRAARDVTA